MPLFNANINLDQNQLQFAVIHSGSTKPNSGSEVAGQIFYDTDTNQLQIYTGSDWEGVVTETKDASTITGVTSLLNTSLVVGRDSTDQIKFSTNDQIIFRVGNADGVIFKASGEIEAASLDISGNADIDGTLEADAITVDGTNILSGGIITTLGTIAQDTILFQSSNADDPLLTIENNANDATGARLMLLKDKGAAGADNDEVGEIIFAGDNDAQEQTNFAKLRGLIADATDGAEGGKFEIRVATHDGEMQPGLVLTDGNAEDEIDVTIGSGSGSVTTINGDLTVTGTTTTVNSTTVNLNDHNIILDSGNSTSAVVNGAGITIEGGTGDDAKINYSTTGPKFELLLGSSYEDLQVDQLIAASLDISGNVDVDGTLEADAITVNGTSLADTIAGTTVTNSTNAAHVLITDNENTNEENQVTFIEGAGGGGANRGLEADGDFTYNPSTGTVSATIFKGNIDAVDGDFDGTLEADAISIDGTTITSTATELNLLDAGTSGSSVTLASGDSIIIGDASASNASKKVLMSDIATFTNSSIEGTGALDSGSITSGFGAIDNGTSGIRTATFTAETAFVPDASDGATLGTSSLEFSDLYLADGAQILFGDDQEVRITHDADTGLTFSHEATGAAKPFVLTIESEEDAITNNDVIGGIQFKAGDSDGTDAILPAVGMFAVATDTFGTASNRAKLIFSVAASETAGLSSGALDATVDMELDHSGKLTITDDFVIGDGKTIGISSDADLMTLTSGVLTVAGEVSATTLDIGGTNISSTATELNLVDGSSAGTIVNSKAVIYGSSGEVNATTLQIGGTSITSTAAEINLIDGGTARGTTALADGDGLLVNDGGTMRMTKVETVATYMTAEHVAAREVALELNNSTSGVSSSDNITYTVTHGFGTRNVMVEVYRNGNNSGSYQTVYTDVTRNGDDTITVVFGSARTAGDYTVMIRAIG